MEGLDPNGPFHITSFTEPTAKDGLPKLNYQIVKKERDRQDKIEEECQPSLVLQGTRYAKGRADRESFLKGSELKTDDFFRSNKMHDG